MTDLEEHGRLAAAEYRKLHSLYADLSDSIQTILRQSFQAAALKVHSAEDRGQVHFHSRTGSRVDPVMRTH